MPKMDDTAAKQEVSKCVHEVHDKALQIARLTQETTALKDQIAEKERKYQELHSQMRDNERAQRHISTRALVGNGRVFRDGDDFFDASDEHWSGRDGHDHADSRSMLHYEHLLARMQGLLGPMRDHHNIVDDLVGIFVDHITQPTERRALLHKMMSDYPKYRELSDDEFGKWLFDYLLDTGHSVSSRLQQLRQIHREESDDD